MDRVQREQKVASYARPSSRHPGAWRKWRSAGGKAAQPCGAPGILGFAIRPPPGNQAPGLGGRGEGTPVEQRNGIRLLGSIIGRNTLAKG